MRTTEMIKRTVLGLILSVTLLTSCTADDATSEHNVMFTGYLSSKGSVAINGEEKELLVTYKVKKGDVLTYDDYTGGNPIYLYPSNGGPRIIGGYTPGTDTTGFIYLDNAPVAYKYPSYSDMHLRYTVE